MINKYSNLIQNFWQLSLDDVFNKIANKDMLPSGGATIGINLISSMSLVIMVFKMTLKKIKYDNDVLSDILSTKINNLTIILTDSQKLTLLDMQLFYNFMQSKDDIHLTQLIDNSITLLQKILDFLTELKNLKISQFLKIDIQIATLYLQSSSEAIILNIIINLQQNEKLKIKYQNTYKNYQQKIKKLIKEL